LRHLTVLYEVKKNLNFIEPEISLSLFSESCGASWYYQSFITNWCTRELL